MRSSTGAAEGERDDTRPRKPVDQHVRVDHIAVCICTYRRRAELTKLLSEIEKQQTGGGFTFSVVSWTTMPPNRHEVPSKRLPLVRPFALSITVNGRRTYRWQEIGPS